MINDFFCYDKQKYVIKTIFKDKILVNSNNYFTLNNFLTITNYRITLITKFVIQRSLS